MRILHTGDWHMNARLNNEKRGGEIISSLRQIAAYLHEKQVDVMIVAGDLFCDRCDAQALGEAVGQIKEIFTPFMERGGTIIALSGNHDKDVFFATLRHAFGLAAPEAPNQKTLIPGRMYLFHRPNLVRLTSRDNTTVQFLMMPYPKEEWLRSLTYDTAAEQHKAKQTRFTDYMNKELIAKHLDTAQPAVLVSHLLIEGTVSRAGYRLGIEQDVAFAPSEMPDHFAYCAYGHIHQPQEAKTGAPWIRYCGSVVRLDAGERADDKSVVLVDIGPHGRTSEPTLLPLSVDPIEKWEFDESHDAAQKVADLQSAWGNHPDRERVLVSLRMFYTPGLDAPDAMRQSLRALFPRLYELDIRPRRVDAEERGAAKTGVDLSDVNGNAIRYVTEKMASDTLRRDELLAALHRLLSHGEPDWEASETSQASEMNETNAKVRTQEKEAV